MLRTDSVGGSPLELLRSVGQADDDDDDDVSDVNDDGDDDICHHFMPHWATLCVET